MNPETSAPSGLVEVVADGPLRVRPLEPGDEARWNAFVERESEATFFHLAEWRTLLERAFGHATFYILAERGDRVEGVLPLGRIRSRLFGDTLVSTPFCVCG